MSTRCFANLLDKLFSIISTSAFAGLDTEVWILMKGIVLSAKFYFYVLQFISSSPQSPVPSPQSLIPNNEMSEIYGYVLDDINESVL